MLRRNICRISTTAKQTFRKFSSAKEDTTSTTFAAVISLYCTYLGANYVSNCLIHPMHKLDYGILNTIFMDGRAIDSSYWGTRLPHLIVVPACLTFYDLVIGSIATRHWGLVSFSKTPGPW